jgi:hypothetical protein
MQPLTTDNNGNDAYVVDWLIALGTSPVARHLAYFWKWATLKFQGRFATFAFEKENTYFENHPSGNTRPDLSRP